MKRQAEGYRDFVFAYDEPEYGNPETKKDNRYLLFRGFADWPRMVNRPEKRFADVEIPFSSPRAERLAEGMLTGLQARQEKWT